jgi:hypothetical protein
VALLKKRKDPETELVQMPKIPAIHQLERNISKSIGN